jgi:hypothetical protein
LSIVVRPPEVFKFLHRFFAHDFPNKKALGRTLTLSRVGRTGKYRPECAQGLTSKSRPRDVQILAQLKKKRGCFSNFLLFIFKKVSGLFITHHSGSAVFFVRRQGHLLGAHRAKGLAQVLGESTF